MKYLVKTTNPPDPAVAFWLNRTTWAFAEDRGQRFDSKGAAQAQLEKSKKFNQGWAYKHAVIVEKT